MLDRDPVSQKRMPEGRMYGLCESDAFGEILYNINNLYCKDSDDY